MKPYVKRLLACALAIAMVMTSVPAAFADTSDKTDLSSKIEKIIVNGGEPIKIIENSNGYRYDIFEDDGVDGDETNPTGSWFSYSVRSIFGQYNYSIIMKDGTVINSVDFGDGSGGFTEIYYDGEEYIPEVYGAEQTKDAPWTAEGGVYEAKISIMGFEDTFEFDIIENPIARIDVKNAPMEIYEHTNGYWQTSYDPETGEEASTGIYHYDWEWNMEYDVVLTDGSVTTIKGLDNFIYEGHRYVLRTEDNQSAEKPWVLGGTYPVTLTLAGHTAGFDVKIISCEDHNWLLGGYGPTCTEKGMNLWTCSKCNTKKSEETPALGHKPVEKVTPATCVHEGRKISYCERCQMPLAEDVVLLPTGDAGHNYGDDYICDHCGDVNEALKPTPVPQPTPQPTPGEGTTPAPQPTPGEGSTPAPTPTPQPEHQHSYEKTVTKATAAKDGSIVEKCACGDVKSNLVINKVSDIKLKTDSYVYNGKKKTAPKIIVKDSQGKVISSKNYTISKPKKALKEIGKYTYTVKFKGDQYAGTKKLTLTIQPKAMTTTKPAAAKKAVTVKWKKLTKAQATGYQVMVATDKKFTKNVKKNFVKGYDKTSYKITKLKAKKTYYTRVRAYKTVNGVKIYSDWSKVRQVKIK